jgi:hypothetical protein
VAVSGLVCPTCGVRSAPSDSYCAKCGSALLTSTPPPPDLYPPRGGSGWGRQILVPGLTVAVIVLLALTYWGVVYEPAHNVVTTQNGVWVVNGASGSLAIQVGCSDCGQKPVPGSRFTIDVNVEVSTASCGSFGCPGYLVQSFSVSAPYSLDQTAPVNLPYTEAAGSFETWALTLTAPAAAGHFPLGGVVGVGYEPG